MDDLDTEYLSQYLSDILARLILAQDLRTAHNPEAAHQECLARAELRSLIRELSKGGAA
jgi:hypothetical protein